MTSEDKNRNTLQALIPRGRSAIISLVIVAITAFALGGLILGGGEQAANGNGGHNHAASSETAARAAETAEPTIWTCSMHPQIQLPKPGKCPICFMDLIPVDTGGGGDLDPSQIRMSETAVKLAGIQTTPVTRAWAERSVRMVGKLDYDETRVSYITAWVPGRIDRLFVDFTGATVRKGDHMVHLYSPELIAAQEELLQAKKAVAALNGASSSVLRSTARETLASVREKLRLYGLTNAQIESIEQEKAPSDHLAITAPASGVVVHKDAKEGMYVATGTRIYTIADLSRLWVLLQAYESDLPWLELGQPLAFTSPSFPGEVIEAKINFIDPVVDPKTRTVDVRAEVKNENLRLKPEMFVSATVKSRLGAEGEIIGPETERAPAQEAPLLIPDSAPLITGKRAIVYVQVSSDEGAVFEGRQVTLGPRAQDHYVVEEGLEEGDLVVTNGAFKIDSELQIQAKPSMMSPEGGAIAGGHDHGGTIAPARGESSRDSAHETGSGEPLGSHAARGALAPVYDAYFEVQMALAGDDFEKAKESYEALADAIATVEMRLFEGEAHMEWMRISKALTDAAREGGSAASMSAARDVFYNLSRAAIELHETFGHAGGDVYYLVFCPMARDNAGAYWLQKDETVWNPFYGSAMLRCGEIREEWSAGGGRKDVGSPKDGAASGAEHRHG